MTAENQRRVAGWVVGIFVFCILRIILINLLKTAGLPGISTLDAPVPGASGFAANVFSLMLGARCGMATYAKNIRGGLAIRGRPDFGFF